MDIDTYWHGGTKTVPCGCGRFCEEAQEAGMDVFRVFDSLNYIEVGAIAMLAIR